MQEMASTKILFGRLNMMIMVIMVVVVMMVMIMRLRVCFLGEVGHRQLGWLSQLLLCFRGWKVFLQFMSKILDLSKITLDS